jgi:hypothetical protein
MSVLASPFADQADDGALGGDPDCHGHLFPDDLGRIADAFDAAAESAAYPLRTGGSLRIVPSAKEGV